MDRDQAKAIVSYLHTAFPVPVWEISTLRLWRHQLEDLAYEPTLAAVVEWVRSESRQPTVADIRRAAVRLSSPPRETVAVDQAWRYVQRCIVRIGHTGDLPENTPPAIRKAVDTIGWRTLCLSDNPVADRAHFFRVYDAIMDREIKRLATGDVAQLTDSVRLEIEHKPA